MGKIVKKDGQFVKRRVYPTSPYAHDNVVVRDACMKIIQNQEKIVCIDEICMYVGNHSTRGWGKRGQRNDNSANFYQNLSKHCPLQNGVVC